MTLETELRDHCDRIDFEKWWLDEMYRKLHVNETKNIVMRNRAKEVNNG